MLRFYTLTIFLGFSCLLTAQSSFQRDKRDYVWLLGYASSAQVPGFGGTRMDFHTTPPTVAYEYRDMNFEAANTSICDAEGNLLFYTNGIYVANYLHEEMDNGTGLNPDPLTEEWAENGLPVPQVVLALPLAGNQYIIIHSLISELEEEDQYGSRYITERLYYTRIDMSENEGEGKVLEKNVSIIEDTIDIGGKLTAIRHANGRDWWVVVADYFSNGFYRLLVTPDTIYNQGLQAIGDTVPSGLGQAAFSPDGTKYARLNIYRLGQDQYVDIYDFDRCTGTFSNPVQFTYRDTAIVGGLAFSENSRFLYITSTRFTYQFDLLSENISGSKSIIGSMLDYPDAITCFFLAQLAPNGEIIISTCGTQDSLHVIHNPNKRNTSSNFEFNGLLLPTRNFRTIPNLPYYGLGPEDGSVCDTLGIDNPVPVAAFEYTADSAALAIEFFDGSFFATQWYWDFGDGSTSTQRHPVHTYAQSGTYNVCLTASNMTGSHTVCDTIQLGQITGLEEVVTHEEVKIYPNPAGDYFVLSGDALLSGRLEIRDLYGRARKTLLPGKQASCRVDTNNLESGMYVVTVEQASGERYNIRLLIVK